jgi:hypothetical protein
MDAEGQDNVPPCQAVVVDDNDLMIGDVLELSKNSSASPFLKD